GTGSEEVRKSGGESVEEEETSEEEEGGFDPIPRTPEDSETESDDEEEQESRLSEEARIQEEEDAEELYQSSSMSSFVSSMLNPLSDVGVESIFMKTSSQVVSLEPPTSIMTPSTIATITTSEYRQTNQFADVVSAIPGIVHLYMD
nr:hypothetical protein [Tanacetum cinerariifolium]